MNHLDAELDPQRLIEEYFLREFSDREMDALNSILAKNPLLKAQFLQSINDDLDLYNVMQHIQEEPVWREKAIVYAQHKSARTIRLNRINRIAAALLVLLGAGLAYRMVVNMSSPASVAAVESAAFAEPVAEVTDFFVFDGDRVLVRNAEDLRLLHMGDPLLEGDLISIPKGGRLSFKYLSDSTTVSFEENSSFEILKSSGAKHLALHDGRMVADVAKQQHGNPFRVMTDDAELVVIGTQFELLNRKETVLSVLSGNVQMNDLSAESSVSVSAGHYAESDKGKLSEPTAFAHENLKPTFCATLPNIPSNHQKTGNKYIVVDSVRELTGRLDFNIPPIKGRVRDATLKLRVFSFDPDRGGNGMVRVKRADRKDSPKLGHHEGRISAGMDLIFNLDPSQLSEGTNELLLEVDKGGNDFWFGAEESSHPPELQLTIIKE